MRRRLVLAILFLACAFAAHAEVQTVEIKSAKTTSYEKDEEGIEVVRFAGDVEIVVTKGNSVSHIYADQIVYDKQRDTLEATGNVVYEHVNGKSGGEKFRGESLLYNLKDQEGVFIGGRVEQDSGSKNSDPYIVHAEITGKDSSTTMAFKNGMLTTCDAEDPHWSINATRIWLLPGNEIAVFNGIFFIGPLPVFYIPFFYYPSDEMIIHPVFGFRNREGTFVQTTTYLFGRKPLPVKTEADGGKTFADFLQGDTLKEQKHNGLFLQNLKEDAKSTDTDYLKVIGDMYSKLGYMVGVDGSLTTDTFLRNLSGYGYFGFSRTLYPPATGLVYSSYDEKGEQNEDSGWFFGKEYPFRYRAGLSTKIDKSPVSFSLNMPIVSDPFFKPDFMDRSEDLNWIKFLTDYDVLALGNSISTETSYSWNASSSLNPKLSATLPYLETAAIKSLSATMTFGSMDNVSLKEDPNASKYSPERKFFYAEKLKPEVSLSFSGKLLTSEQPNRREKKAKKTADISGIKDPFAEEVDTSETESGAKADDGTEGGPASEDGTDAAIETGEEIKKKNEEAAQEALDLANRFMQSPVLVPSWTTPFLEPAWSISWSLSPSAVQEVTYDNSKLLGPEEVDFNEYALIFTSLKTDAEIVGVWTYDKDLLSLSSGIRYSGKKQEHPYFSDETYDKTKIESIRLTDYKSSIYTISNRNKVAVVPFNRNELFKPVSVEWNLEEKLIETSFDGTVQKPSWEKKEFEWEKEYITTHSLTSVAGVSLFDKTEKFSMTNNLPPLLGSYKYDASLGWAFLDSTMSTRYFEKEKEKKKWFWDPFKATLTWTLPFGISLGQSYTYDLEEKEHTQFVFTAKKGFFSADYAINNTVPYKLVEGTGWILDGTEKEFIPTALTVSFNNSSKRLQLHEWKNRVYLEGSLDSNLKIDLLRATSSSFSFTPALVLKVHQFVDITFSSTSTNDVVARYFQDWIDLPAPLPGESDIAKDLANSLSLYDQDIMRSSGFKLKKLNLGVTHYLHDWTAKFNTTIEPILKKDGPYHYEFSPTISFIVEWKPISDIKTTVKSKEGVFTLNTTNKEAKKETAASQ